MRSKRGLKIFAIVLVALVVVLAGVGLLLPSQKQLVDISATLDASSAKLC